MQRSSHIWKESEPPIGGHVLAGLERRGLSPSELERRDRLHTVSGQQPTDAMLRVIGDRVRIAVDREETMVRVLTQIEKLTYTALMAVWTFGCRLLPPRGSTAVLRKYRCAGHRCAAVGGISPTSSRHRGSAVGELKRPTRSRTGERGPSTCWPRIFLGRSACRAVKR